LERTDRGYVGVKSTVNRVCAEVVESESLPGEHHRLLLRAPAIAGDAVPGQFIHVWCHPPEDIAQPPSAAILRRPYSISRVRLPDGIEVLLRVRGTGGTMLARTQPGAFLDVLGPLGRGFHASESVCTVVVVAGGIGLAPAPFLVETLAPQVDKVILLAGAAADESIPYRVDRGASYPATIPSLAALGAEVVFCSEKTDNLLVGDLLERRLSEFDQTSTEIMAIGPRAMLKRVAGMIGSRFRLWVSLEERMACGVGACRSCVVPVRYDDGAYKTVCREGPVFDAAEIDWERLDP